MAIFDNYLKKYISDFNASKKDQSGGGGGAGAFTPEPYKPIDFNEYLKAPSTEEMNQEQDALLTFEKDYEAITLAIDTNYELYKEYTKQLDDLEEELQTAPPDMEFNLNQKYNQLRDAHNTLVEKLQGDTKRQKEIYKEYTKIRTTYDKDIEIYNRWAEAQNKKQEETKEALKETKDPTWGKMIYHTLRAGLNQANANFWNVFRMVEMGKIEVEDKIDDFFFPGAKDRNKKFEEKYGKDPDFSLPLDVLTDLVVDAEKNVAESAPQAESQNWLKQSMNIGLRPVPQIVMSAAMGAAIPMTPTAQLPLSGGAKLTANWLKDWLRMTPFGAGAGAGKAREIEKQYEEFNEEAPYMKMLVSGTLTGLGEMATEMPVFLGVMKVINKYGAGTLINQSAKTVIGKYGKAASQVFSNIFLQGFQEGEMYLIGKSIDEAMGDPQDWSKEDIMEGTWRDFYGGLMMGFCMLGLSGGVGGSMSIATKSKRAFDRFVKDEDELQTTLRKILEYQGIIMEEPEIEALAYKAEEEEKKVEPKEPKIRVSAREKKEDGGKLIDIFLPKNVADKIPKNMEWTSKIKGLPKELDKYTMLFNTGEVQKAEPIPKAKPKLFEGEAYRGELESQKEFKTAQEKLDYDAKMFGNINIKVQLGEIAKDIGIDLSEIKSEDIIWVAKDKKVAEKYGEVKKVEIPKDTVTLIDDKEGGYLILKNVEKYTKEVIPKVTPEALAEIKTKEKEELKKVEEKIEPKEKLKVIPKELEPLAKEARKAKDVEEFIKNINKTIRPIREAKVGELVIIESPTYGEKSATQYNTGIPTQGEIVKINPKSVAIEVADGTIYKFPESAKVSALDLIGLKGKDKQGIQDFYKQAIAKPIKEKTKPLEEQLKESQKEINRLKGIIKTIKGNKEKRQEFKKKLVTYIKENMPYAIRNKMIATVKNVSGDKALEKAMEKIDEYTLEHYSRQYTKAINNELKAKKIKPKRQKSGMLKGRFTPAIQDKLDFIRTNINGSRTEAMRKISENITLFNEGKAINIAEENELLNMIGIKEMDLETLQSTLVNIKSLKKEGKTLNAIKAAKNQARHEEDRIKTIETLTGKEVEIDEESGKAIIDSSYRTKPKTKEWGGILAGIRKFVDRANNWQFHLDSLLDKLSALDKTSKPFQSPLSKIGDRVHYARVNSITSLEKAIDMLQIKFVEAYEAVSKKDILKITQKLREEIDLGEFKNSEGSKVKFVLNKEQIIKKVMQLDDPSLELTFKEGMLYTEEIENALRGALSEKDLAWIEGQREIYDYMWKRINPIFEEMYGIHFPYNPFYSGTIRRDVDLDIPEATLMSQDLMRFTSILNPSLKARSKTKQSLVYDEATNSLMNYVMQMEHFINWAKPLQDLRSIFGDGRVKSVLNELYGHDILNKINGFLDDMTRDGIDKGKIIKWVDTIRFNFTRSVLAKPHLGLKQIPSVLAYMTEIPVTDFVKGIHDFWKNPIKNYRYLIEHSPYAKERFGEGFERDIHGAMKSDYYHVLAHSHKISDLMMGFVRAGDKFAVMQGMWTVMYSETKGQTRNAGVKKVEEAFVRGAIITDRTQPSFHTESMATGQRGGSLMKLFTMFQTQPNKYYQLIANNARNFKYGRGSRMKAASNIALAWAILPMLFQFIGDGGKWIEKHQLRALILGGANHILVFGAMIRGMYGFLIKEGYDVPASPVFATLREAEYCLAKIAKWSDPDKDLTPEDIQAFCEHFAKGLGQFVGLPTPYGVQVKKAIESGDYRQLLFSEYILKLGEEKGKKKKPYVKSYGKEKYGKYLKGGYTKKSKYGKYLKY